MTNLRLLCSAAAYYFNGEYSICSDRLRKIPQRTEAFSMIKQYLFSLRLRAFCHYKMGRYERAVQLLQLLYKETLQKKTVAGGLYNSRGMVQKGNTDEAGSSLFEEYYRLREIAAEDARGEHSSS